MGNKKILFIVAPTFPYSEYCCPSEKDYYHVVNGKKRIRILSSLPLGILSISSYLKQHVRKVDIRILDFNLIIHQMEDEKRMDDYVDFQKLYMEKLTELSGFQPQYVGITSNFNTAYECIKELAQCSRLVFPNSCIVSGGGISTNAYDILLKEAPEIDIACIGEGELPIAHLVAADSVLIAVNTDSALVTREKLEQKAVIERRFLIDLDEIDLSKVYHLIDFYAYSDTRYAYGNLFAAKDSSPIILNLCSTRGCPHLCSFCCSHSVHGRSVRYHSAKHVIQEIEYAIEAFSANTVTFVDDNFLMDKTRAKEILLYLGTKSLNVTFPNGFTIYAIDEEIAQLLKAAGVKEAALALESGNQETLDKIIRKPLKLSMVAPAIQCLQDVGIYVRGFFMLGFPGETKAAMQESIDFLLQLNFNWTMCYIVTPYYGSEVYRICDENGYLESDTLHGGGFFKQSLINTKDFSSSYVTHLVYLTNLRANFIHNYDMKSGRYALALARFEKIAQFAEDHAIAYYCAAICCMHLGDEAKANIYQKKYFDIVDQHSEWRAYAEELGLSKVNLKE